MSQKVYEAGATGLDDNQHVSHQSSTIKNVDLHWESRSGTSNRGQAGEMGGFGT